MSLWDKIKKWFNPSSWFKTYIVTDAQKKEFYQKAEKGDIVFFSQDNLIGDGIQVGTDSEWVHTGIYAGSHKIIHIVNDGMKEENIDVFFNGKYKHIEVKRYKDITVDEVYSIMSWLYKTKKTNPKYDKAQILTYVIEALTNKEINLDSDEKYICSELCFLAYVLNDLPLFNKTVKKIKVTPAFLYSSPKLNTVYNLKCK